MTYSLLQTRIILKIPDRKVRGRDLGTFVEISSESVHELLLINFTGPFRFFSIVLHSLVFPAEDLLVVSHAMPYSTSEKPVQSRALATGVSVIGFSITKSWIVTVIANRSHRNPKLP